MEKNDFDKNSFFNNNNFEKFDNILCDQQPITTTPITPATPATITNLGVAQNGNAGTLKVKKCKLSGGDIKTKDRNLFHGSLPNHLDADVDCEGSDDTNSSGELFSCFYNSYLFSNSW